MPPKGEKKPASPAPAKGKQAAAPAKQAVPAKQVAPKKEVKKKDSTGPAAVGKATFTSIAVGLKKGQHIKKRKQAIRPSRTKGVSI